MPEIDWDNLPNAQLIEMGRWLYWAESWATFKALSSDAPFPRNAWKAELQFLLRKQEVLRAVIDKRKLPLKPHEPSHMPVPDVA